MGEERGSGNEATVYFWGSLFRRARALQDVKTHMEAYYDDAVLQALLDQDAHPQQAADILVAKLVSGVWTHSKGKHFAGDGAAGAADECRGRPGRLRVEGRRVPVGVRAGAPVRGQARAGLDLDGRAAGGQVGSEGGPVRRAEHGRGAGGSDAERMACPAEMADNVLWPPGNRVRLLSQARTVLFKSKLALQGPNRSRSGVQYGYVGRDGTGRDGTEALCKSAVNCGIEARGYGACTWEEAVASQDALVATQYPSCKWSGKQFWHWLASDALRREGVWERPNQ